MAPQTGFAPLDWALAALDSWGYLIVALFTISENLFVTGTPGTATTFVEAKAGTEASLSVGSLGASLDVDQGEVAGEQVAPAFDFGEEFDAARAGDIAGDDGELRERRAHELDHLTDAGRVVEACWREIPTHYPFVQLDMFAVMPDHLHGIVVLGSVVLCITGGEALSPERLLLRGTLYEEDDPSRAILADFSGVLRLRTDGSLCLESLSTVRRPERVRSRNTP
mgnify:CR=1 FL=1